MTKKRFRLVHRFAPRVLERFFTFLRVTCRDDSGIFDHQNHCPLRGSRPMHHRPRHHKRLTGRQFYDAILKIDQKPPGNDIKELIILIMFVPMVFPFNDADPNHRSIHFAQGLVEPFEVDGFREFEGYRSIRAADIGYSAGSHREKLGPPYSKLEINRNLSGSRYNRVARQIFTTN